MHRHVPQVPHGFPEAPAVCMSITGDILGLITYNEVGFRKPCPQRFHWQGLLVALNVISPGSRSTGDLLAGTTHNQTGLCTVSPFSQSPRYVNAV